MSRDLRKFPMYYKNVHVPNVVRQKRIFVFYIFGDASTQISERLGDTRVSAFNGCPCTSIITGVIREAERPKTSREALTY